MCAHRLVGFGGECWRPDLGGVGPGAFQVHRGGDAQSRPFQPDERPRQPQEEPNYFPYEDDRVRPND